MCRTLREQETPLMSVGYALMFGDREWKEEERRVEKKDNCLQKFRFKKRRPRFSGMELLPESPLTPEEILIRKEEDPEFQQSGKSKKKKGGPR